MARRSVPLVSALIASGVLVLMCACQAVPSPSTDGAPSRFASAASSAATSASPSPAGPVAAADYLVEGTPGQPDADGNWTGHYGFFTDASGAVRCDLFVFSGSPGAVTCGITPGHEAERSYAIPAGVSTSCDTSGALFPTDGTQVVMGGTGLDAPQAFSGCIDQSQYDPAIVAKTRVLPPDRPLQVTRPGDAAPDFVCTVHAAVATCTDTDGGRIRFGATVAVLG